MLKRCCMKKTWFSTKTCRCKRPGLEFRFLLRPQSTTSSLTATNFDSGNTPEKFFLRPGHTPGSICLHLPEGSGKLFSGDTLFYRSIGRTDLWGGSQETIFRSLRDKLLALEDKTVVYPGHGQPTTIGEERRLNPFLAAR